MRAEILTALLAVGWADAFATCPDYASLRQPSVSVEAGFTMSKLDGVWNILATSEPTIPKFCRTCGVVDFTVYGADYRYVMTAMCQIGGAHKNMSIPLGGHIGGPTEEGNCMENAALFNHTVERMLMPNMFFNYTDDWYMSYACGSMLGKNIRSFFLGTRNPMGKTRAWIDEKIEWAKTLGILEGWENLAITDDEELKNVCWANAAAAEQFLV